MVYLESFSWFKFAIINFPFTALAICASGKFCGIIGFFYKAAKPPVPVGSWIVQMWNEKEEIPSVTSYCSNLQVVCGTQPETSCACYCVTSAVSISDTRRTKEVTFCHQLKGMHRQCTGELFSSVSQFLTKGPFIVVDIYSYKAY